MIKNMFRNFGKALIILQLCTNIAISMDDMQIEEEYNNNNVQNIEYIGNNNIQNNSLDKIFNIKYINNTKHEDLNKKTSEPTIISRDKQEIRNLYTLLKHSENTNLKDMNNNRLRRGFNKFYDNKMFSDRQYKNHKNNVELFDWIRSFCDFDIKNNPILNIIQINGILLLTKTASLIQQQSKKSVFASIIKNQRSFRTDANNLSCDYPRMATTLFNINFIKNSINNFFSTDKQNTFGEHSKICIIPETFHKFLDATELCSNYKLKNININQFVITHEDYISFLDVLIKNFIVNLLQLCNDNIKTYLFPEQMQQKMNNLFSNQYNEKGLISFLGEDCVNNIANVLYKRFRVVNKKYNFIDIIEHFDFFSNFFNERVIDNPLTNNESLYDEDKLFSYKELKKYLDEQTSRISNIFSNSFNEMKELLSSNNNEIIKEIRNEWSDGCRKYTIDKLTEVFNNNKTVESNFSKYLNNLLINKTQNYFFTDLNNYMKQCEIALCNTDIALKLIIISKLLNDGKNNSYVYDNIINKPFFKILPRHLCFNIAKYIIQESIYYKLIDTKNSVILGIFDVDDKYNIIPIKSKDRIIPVLRKIW